MMKTVNTFVKNLPVMFVMFIIIISIKRDKKKNKKHRVIEKKINSQFIHHYDTCTVLVNLTKKHHEEVGHKTI